MREWFGGLPLIVRASIATMLGLMAVATLLAAMRVIEVVWD